MHKQLNQLTTYKTTKIQTYNNIFEKSINLNRNNDLITVIQKHALFWFKLYLSQY